MHFFVYLLGLILGYPWLRQLLIHVHGYNVFDDVVVSKVILKYISISPGFICTCPTGVKLRENSNTTCYTSPQSLLLVAQRSMISKISLDSPDFTPYTLPLRDLKRALTVDFDPKHEYLYWADSSVSTSFRHQNISIQLYSQSLTLDIEVQLYATLDKNAWRTPLTVSYLFTLLLLLPKRSNLQFA